MRHAGAGALCLAAEAGCREAVRALSAPAAAGPDAWGSTALQWAAARGRDVAVALLLEEGRADVRAADRDGVTALHAAAARCGAPTVEALLRAGADPAAADGELALPLHWAAAAANAAALAALLEACRGHAAALRGARRLRGSGARAAGRGRLP
ncbi:ankyrin repeat domain-containing protein 65-like [Schistocerca nitens]|uniref:ankyrin repeat domain-containing protein 65-like n=1 Tax=Schistocerca nitens TaxID=7011 RepID=UPI002118E3F3|nr:ankyrin repeat domain-containing protein 65-like [Schistocerca nitens]